MASSIELQFNPAVNFERAFTTYNQKGWAGLAIVEQV
jgi:hypothetical protein